MRLEDSIKSSQGCTRSILVSHLFVLCSRLGRTIDLSLAEEHTHPHLDLDTPLPPPPKLTNTASAAIEAFIMHTLPSCSFLTPARIRHLFDRWSQSASSLSPDQLALIYACLACGYVRIIYFGGNMRCAVHVSPDLRTDIPWYRHAVSTLASWGSATFTSLRESTLRLDPNARRPIRSMVLHHPCHT